MTLKLQFPLCELALCVGKGDRGDVNFIKYFKY